MNFGKAIVLSFVLFGLFIGALVTVCVRQDVSLVTKNYYQEELDYQQKLDKINNANDLTSLPEITAAQGRVKVVYDGFGKIEVGELKLSRPSNARLDEKFSLAPIAGDSQEFALRFWEPGLYRASLTWTAGGKTYEVEKAIVF